MAQLTPEFAKERMELIRRLDLPSGHHVFIRVPTAADILSVAELATAREQTLYMLSRILCYEDGTLYYPNGTGIDELGNWPAEMITEIANFDFLDLDTAAAKKN